MHITGSFAGGNPQSQENIVALGGRSYAIFPYSEDEDPVYKFRLDLKVSRDSSDTGDIALVFDWKEERFSEYRSRIFVKFPGEEWVCRNGLCDGSQVTLSLDPPSGETYLTLNPKYDYQDYLDLVHRFSAAGDLEKELVYTSRSGREVWLLSSRVPDDSLRILVTARTHPYETGGSYCVEGFLESRVLGKNGPPPKLFILPMLSPDGVCDGLCKLSQAGGEDIARSSNREDPLVDRLFLLIDRIRPHFILDFHNWMLPHENGLFYESPRWMRKFVRVLERKGHADRRWRLGTRRRFFPETPSGVKAYAKQKYGTRCMTVEYPWFGRTIHQMKALGADTVATLTELLQ